MQWQFSFWMGGCEETWHLYKRATNWATSLYGPLDWTGQAMTPGWPFQSIFGHLGFKVVVFLSDQLIEKNSGRPSSQATHTLQVSAGMLWPSWHCIWRLTTWCLPTEIEKSHCCRGAIQRKNSCCRAFCVMLLLPWGGCHTMNNTQHGTSRLMIANWQENIITVHHKLYDKYIIPIFKKGKYKRNQIFLFFFIRT